MTAATFSPLSLVTKLNKGTSRDEWGSLNYWGYKAPDGLIRSRVTPPDDKGQSHIEVRFYDITKKASYRKRLDWDEATLVGSSFIKVSDTEKGPNAKDMIAEVNTLIEIYNDTATKHIGRKIVRTEAYRKTDTYNTNDDRLNPYIVNGVEVRFDYEFNMTVKLNATTGSYSGSRTFLVNEVEDYASDSGKAAIREQIAAFREKLADSENFLRSLEAALANGQVVGEVGYTGPGFLPSRELNNVIRTMNEVTEREAINHTPA